MFWSFVLAATIIELTPGPNMTWLAVLGARHGRGSALAAVLGIAVGLSVAAVVAGAGLAALFAQFPQMLQLLRWAGTLYLIYLAYDAWRDAETRAEDSAQNLRQSFMQGLVSNVLNPKAYLFYVAMLPQFVDQSQAVGQQIATLSIVYVVIATAIHSAIALLAGSAATFLQGSPRAVVLRRAMALGILLTAIWFFISTGGLT